MQMHGWLGAGIHSQLRSPEKKVSDYETLVFEPDADGTFTVDRDWAVCPSPSASASMPDHAGVRGTLKMTFQSSYELYTMTC